MKIAIDEVGDFRLNSENYNYFVAVHIRSLVDGYEIIRNRFEEWEKSLPSDLKDLKGEVKSRQLNEEQLSIFVEQILRKEPIVPITPLCFKTNANPKEHANNYKAIELKIFKHRIDECRKVSNNKMEEFYTKLHNWHSKLNYQQYTKLFVLANCISRAFVNTVGFCINSRLDDELLDISFMIDKDFIKEGKQSKYWKELLRNYFYYSSRDYPVIMLNNAEVEERQSLKKFQNNFDDDLQILFKENCNFCKSHENFEIRIADAVGTILHRHYNQNKHHNVYDRIRPLFITGKITEIVLGKI